MKPVSGNGLQLCSGEFVSFVTHLGITRKRGASYHPATNGLPKFFVQTVKDVLRISSSGGGSIPYRLDRIFFWPTTLPHTQLQARPLLT